MRAVLADIQRGAEQLQMSMTMNYDGSHANDWPENAWKKLPRGGKKTFDGWPVREVSEGHVSRRTTFASIDEAYPNGNKYHPRNLDEDKEAHGENGLTTAAQRMSSPQNTDDQASRPSVQLNSPVTSQTSKDLDVDLLRTTSTASPSSSHYYSGYPNNLATFSMPSSPLSRSSSSALFSPLRERLYVHPIEWTVEETVHWLRSKGFEDIVCKKFIEQETTGDALLNLDVTSLKTEIGINTYGKRFRIASAIDDLRRVASVRFPSVTPTWSRSPSQRLGLKPFLLRSSNGENLMSFSPQPNLGHLPETPILSPCREPDPDVLAIVQNPTKSVEKTQARGRVSPSHSSRSGQGKAAPGRSSQLSSYRSDEALGVSTKRAAINREGEKRGNAVQADRDTIQLATQRHDPRNDRESSSSSTVKMALSPSMEIVAPLPRITQLKRRSQSMREWRKGRLDSQYEPSPTSTLVGTAGLIPKSRQHSPGNSIGSVPPLSINADTCNRKEDKNEKYQSSSSGGSKGKNPSPLRRSASVSLDANASLAAGTEANPQTLVDTVMLQIGTPDHEGWIRKKGGHFSTWKSRYLVLKGAHLYWLRTDSSMSKVEGQVNVAGYRVVPDETIGSYGFKLLRGSDRVHFFSSDNQTVIREWMKALRKPNIKRDHMKTMVPSTDVRLVPLEIARAMSPRPPSPTTAAATQRNHRRENLKQMSKMQSMPSFHGQKDRTSSPSMAGSSSNGFTTKAVFSLSPSGTSKAPVRPPRDARRKGPQLEHQLAEQGLIKWANGHLPAPINHRTSNYNGLDLLRIAESIKDIGGSCVPKSIYSQSPDHETLEGLFALIDFLLDEDANSGTVNMNDVLRSKREKVFQLLRALRAWEGHRAVPQQIGMNAPQEGPSQAITRVG